MARIELETFVAAPPERCFDLSLSVGLHERSMAHTGERAVRGVTSGTLQLGDEVTWEARHFGVKLQLSTAITAYDRPRMFRDEMTHGPLRSMAHTHTFEARGDGTLMRDVFEFRSPAALLLRPYFRRLLVRRNAAIRYSAIARTASS
jgi:ligand-binding SRPBCC domain-containing protein